MASNFPPNLIPDLQPHANILGGKRQGTRNPREIRPRPANGTKKSYQPKALRHRPYNPPLEPRRLRGNKKTFKRYEPSRAAAVPLQPQSPMGQPHFSCARGYLVPKGWDWDAPCSGGLPHSSQEPGSRGYRLVPLQPL